MEVPAMMNAVYYEQPRAFEVRSIPIPEISDTDVLLKVSCCGICGTDKHLHEGNFLAKFPLIPGHEIVGAIAKMGESVTGLAIGDRCVADPIVSCGVCLQCHRGKTHLCKSRAGRGIKFPGGLAEYVIFSAKDVHKISTITDEQATLVEPMACVLHGIDMLNHTAGAEALVFGAGPSGLLFCQLLKVNGVIKVVLASNKGRKMEIAKQINAADEYVEFDRDESGSQWTQLKEHFPEKFDIVIEATGSEEVLNKAIYHVRRGGTLLMYSLYASDCNIKWPAVYVFTEEIQIATAIGQSHCLSRAIAYLESGKIRTEGIVTDSYTIHQYQEAIDKLKARDSCKVIVKPS